MAQTSNYKRMRYGCSICSCVLALMTFFLREIMDKANSEGGPVHNGIMYCGIVPYLGIFQSDFTFLDEGSQTFSSPGATTPRTHRPQTSRKCPLLLYQRRARELEKSQSFLFGHQEDQRVLVTFGARVSSILLVTSGSRRKRTCCT